jgi:hypothetical protein
MFGTQKPSRRCSTLSGPTLSALIEKNNVEITDILRLPAAAI